ncbi:hypothetical protein BJX99DRAFT_226624 [Aspergillus californicus]
MRTYDCRLLQVSIAYSTIDGTRRGASVEKFFRICKKMNIMRQCCIETPARVPQTSSQSQITASYEGKNGRDRMLTYQFDRQTAFAVLKMVSAGLQCG